MIHAFAYRLVLPIAAVVGVAQTAAANVGRDYWFDEVYMLAIGRSHLDWGSADQPPLTPALAAVSDAILPGSLLALRIPAIVATTGAVVVAALIAREMGCDGRAQALVAGAQATGVWLAVAGHWLTPYTLEPIQWLVAVWLLVRWLRVRDDRLLLILGAAAGVAAMTKFQVLLLCAVLLCTVLAVGPRDMLRRPMLWGGVAIGALICAPTLWWQAQHGWPQLRMAQVVAEEAGPLSGGRPGIAVALLAYAGVAGLALVGYGLVRLVRDHGFRDYRFLGLTFVVLYALFVATGGRPYYLCGLYVAPAAIGALALQRRREGGARRWRWAVWPAYALSVAAAVGGVILGATLTQSTSVSDDIVGRTAQAYQALPTDVREHTAIVGESYIVAAYIDGYADRYGLPAAYSLTRSYGYFPPPDDAQDSVMFVGSSPERLEPYFTETRRLGEETGDIDTWLLTGRTAPWTELWSRLRTLRVV